MEPNLLYEGVTLMVVGMATVFVFLTVLVGAMTLMSGIIGRYLPEPPGEPVDARLLAAIGAAVAEHRRHR